jgi:hypothetical protein
MRSVNWGEAVSQAGENKMDSPFDLDQGFLVQLAIKNGAFKGGWADDAKT